MPADASVKQELLVEPAEASLAAKMAALQGEVGSAFEQGDFTGALRTLALMKDEVDAFFTDVMVMADDVNLRNNRLALLSQLHGMMNRVADISKLAS